MTWPWAGASPNGLVDREGQRCPWGAPCPASPVHSALWPEHSGAVLRGHVPRRSLVRSTPSRCSPQPRSGRGVGFGPRGSGPPQSLRASRAASRPRGASWGRCPPKEAGAPRAPGVCPELFGAQETGSSVPSPTSRPQGVGPEVPASLEGHLALLPRRVQLAPRGDVREPGDTQRAHDGPFVRHEVRPLLHGGRMEPCVPDCHSGGQGPEWTAGAPGCPLVRSCALQEAAIAPPLTPANVPLQRSPVCRSLSVPQSGKEPGGDEPRGLHGTPKHLSALVRVPEDEGAVVGALNPVTARFAPDRPTPRGAAVTVPDAAAAAPSPC